MQRLGAKGPVAGDKGGLGPEALRCPRKDHAQIRLDGRDFRQTLLNGRLGHDPPLCSSGYDRVDHG
jgi:hypothetical protein